MTGGTIHMPEELMSQIEDAAAAQRRSPDALVREAVESYLRRQRLEKLYAYGESQALKLNIRETDVPALVEQTRRETERPR